MHRLIMGFPKTLVDHIKHYDFDSNRNMLIDNRKSNLRLATSGQNIRNQRKRKTNMSGYKGVSFSKTHRKFRAQIGYNGSHYHLGYYLTAIEAAKVYDEAALKYHGEFARINMIPGKRPINQQDERHYV